MEDPFEKALNDEENRMEMAELTQERKESLAETLVKGYGDGDFTEWLIDVFVHSDQFERFYDRMMDEDDSISGEIIREAWEKEKWDRALKDADDYI